MDPPLCFFALRKGYLLRPLYWRLLAEAVDLQDVDDTLLAFVTALSPVCGQIPAVETETHPCSAHIFTVPDTALLPDLPDGQAPLGSHSQQLPVRRRTQILDIFVLGMYLVNRELKQFERILTQVHGHGEVRKQDPQRHSPPQEKGIFQAGGFSVPIVRFLLQFSQSADFDGHFVDHIKADCAQNDDGKDNNPERGEYVTQVGYEAQNVLPSFKQEVRRRSLQGCQVICKQCHGEG